MAEKPDQEAGAAPKKGKGRWLLLLAVLALAAGGGGAAAAFFLLGGGEAEGEAVDQARAEPIYYAIEPPITVNFQRRGRVRFLQVSMQVMSHDPEVIQALQRHMPVVRNNLNLLFSSQSYEELISREGKEQLRRRAATEIDNVLSARAGLTGVEEVYFTGFVMQ